MFDINFYVSCFDSRRKLNCEKTYNTWDKAVYRLLFVLANTLQSHGKNVLIKNMLNTYDFQENNRSVTFLENMQEIIALKANIGSFKQISVSHQAFSLLIMRSAIELEFPVTLVCRTPQCCKAPHFICPLISHEMALLDSKKF